MRIRRKESAAGQVQILLIMHDGTKLPMDDILDISGEIFAMIE